MDFNKFFALCAAEAQLMTRHGEEYLKDQIVRLYETFKICSELIPLRAKILSVGAGGAYVEKLLKDFYGAEVTVIEFPEAVESHREDYARHGFHAISLNLTTDWQLQTPHLFDMAFSFEVVEHLSVSPYQHIKSLSDNLKSGAYLVLSTPNLACLHSIIRLLRGQPILSDAQLTFLPSSYENERIHRREYVASEIVGAMTQAGLTHLKTYYTFSAKPNYPSLKGQVARLFYALNPRFKPIMLLVARKN